MAIGRRRQRRRAGESSFSRINDSKEDYWVDILQDKAEDTFRFVQLNIGNMAEKRNSAEFRAFRGKVEEV